MSRIVSGTSEVSFERISLLKNILNKVKKKMDFGGVVLVGDGLAKHVRTFWPDYFSNNCHMGSKSEKNRQTGE